MLLIHAAVRAFETVIAIKKLIGIENTFHSRLARTVAFLLEI